MYWLGKASHFNNLKHVIFGPIGDQKLGNTRNSYKVKSGVSQIHLRQLFHFINVRCNYCLQLSCVSKKTVVFKHAQKQHFCRTLGSMHMAKEFKASSAFAESLPTSATLSPSKFLSKQSVHFCHSTQCISSRVLSRAFVPALEHGERGSELYGSSPISTFLNQSV